MSNHYHKKCGPYKNQLKNIELPPTRE